MSEAYDKACAAWVDEVVKENRPFAGERMLEGGMRAPEPATHVDPRMHLTGKDMPSTEPAWPNGVKQQLTGYRHTVQSDRDPDTKQHSMVTEQALVRADCPGDAEDGHACSKCGRYETITNGRHPCADGISQAKYDSIARFSEDLRAGKGGDLVVTALTRRVVERTSRSRGVDVRGGPDGHSSQSLPTLGDNAPLTSTSKRRMKRRKSSRRIKRRARSK